MLVRALRGDDTESQCERAPHCPAPHLVSEGPIVASRVLLRLPVGQQRFPPNAASEVPIVATLHLPVPLENPMAASKVASSI